jgi:hypothetical protein
MWIELPLFAEAPQETSGLWPERTAAFLPALTKQSHLKGLGQLQITDAQVQDLLNASAGVEEDSQQSVVTPPVERRLIHSGEDQFDLFILQIFNGALAGALEGNGQYPLTLLKSVGISGGRVAKEWNAESRTLRVVALLWRLLSR